MMHSTWWNLVYIGPDQVAQYGVETLQALGEHLNHQADTAASSGILYSCASEKDAFDFSTSLRKRNITCANLPEEVYNQVKKNIDESMHKLVYVGVEELVRYDVNDLRAIHLGLPEEEGATIFSAACGMIYRLESEKSARNVVNTLEDMGLKVETYPDAEFEELRERISSDGGRYVDFDHHKRKR